jgi:gamma-glutamyltranspeptidase/glutathione hydrolase
MIRSHTTPSPRASVRTGAERGTVVAPHETSIAAGLDMLERGGNAVDAAVAAALVSGVVEPTETTLAGSGFMLFHDTHRQSWSVDFGPRAPRAASPTMFEIDAKATSPTVLGLAPVVGNANVDGPLACGVPRTLVGLLTAQERFGRLPREVVCAPAVAAAYDGFPADMWFLTSALNDLDRLRADPQAARTFLTKRGLPLGSESLSYYGPTFGQRARVRQPMLGATLEEAARSGTQTLTHGRIAQRLAASSADLGGLLALDDFRASAPSIGPAVIMQYRDAEVAIPAGPGGGHTELQILAIWQALHPAPTTSHGNPAHLRDLALTIRHAFADRYHWLGDPSVVPVPAQALLHDSYARHLADLVAAGDDVPHWGDGAPWITYAGRAVHDPWPLDTGGWTSPTWDPSTASAPTSGTTHISAADASGQLVSITHTAANHFGNGQACPRTGLLFDSAMAWFNAAPGAANSITPGGRALANMGPALVTRGGAPVAALGASGGRRIISAVAQIIINLVDGGHNFADALTLPRIDASGPTVLVPEARVSELGALEDLGATLVPASPEPYAMDFARPNMAGFDRSPQPTSVINANHYD